MGTAYVKTSPTNFVDGETIQAADFTTEFDAIDAAFETGGHQHDGTDGEGGAIEKLLSNTITLGTGADTDIAVTFNANTADGVLTWMEDEDYFKFSDDLLIDSTEKIQFRDAAIYIHSSTDGQLDLVADTEIQIAATSVDVNGAVNISGIATHGAAIVSDTDSTDDLGTTGVRWANLFVDGITATDQITATGFTGTLDGVLGSGAAAAATVTTLTTSGVASIDDTTDTTSGTTGSIHTDGGVGIAKALFVGTTSKLVGVTTHGGNVVSDTDSTDDLGTTGVRWANLFVDAITATDQVVATGFTGTLDGILGSGTPAAATVTQLTSGGVIVSDTDSTDDLGTTGVRWANLFVDAITVTDQVVATGFTGTLDGILGSGTAAAADVTTLDATAAITGGTIILAATDTDTSNTGSITIDFSAHQNFVLTLTGSITLANPSTEVVGQAGVFVFIQDGTGSRTLSLGTDYESPASGGITLSTAANAVDVVPYFVKASGSIQLGAPQLAFG